MVVTFHTFTASNFFQVAGSSFDPRTAKAVIGTNLADNQAIVAGVQVRIGRERVNFDSNGDLTIADLIASDSDNTNIDPLTPLQYRLTVEWTSSVDGNKTAWHSPAFELNGAGPTDLADIIPVYDLPASVLSDAITAVEDARDAAIQAILDIIVLDLGTSDAQIWALLTDNGSLASEAVRARVAEVVPDLVAEAIAADGTVTAAAVAAVADALTSQGVVTSNTPAIITTNLIKDPNFVVGYAGFSTGAQGLMQLKELHQHRTGGGKRSLRVYSTGSASAANSILRRSEDNGNALKTSQQYTFSAYVYVPSSNTSVPYLRATSDDATMDVSGTSTAVKDTITLLTVTFTTPATAQQINIFKYAGTGSVADAYFSDLSLVEGSARVEGDGDDVGWAWSGLSYRSSSNKYALAKPLPPYLGEKQLRRSFARANGPIANESSLTAPAHEVQRVPATVTTQTIGGSDPIPVKQYGNIIYGARGNVIHGSRNSGRTWTALFDMGTLGGAPGAKGVQFLVRTNDGEVLVSRGIFGLWKSSGGFQAAETSGVFTGVAFTQVITTTTAADTHKGEIVPVVPR